MSKQITLSTILVKLVQTNTREKEFINPIDRIIPWSECKGILERHFNTGECCNKPFNFKKLLRIYLVQSLSKLSGMTTMTDIIDSRVIFVFCGVNCLKDITEKEVESKIIRVFVDNKKFFHEKSYK